MTAQRILLINEDGTCVVGGVEYVLVPKEPQREMLHSADNMMDGDLAYSDLQAIYYCMLSAAAIDLAGLPREVIFLGGEWCPEPAPCFVTVSL